MTSLDKIKENIEKAKARVSEQTENFKKVFAMFSNVKNYRALKRVNYEAKRLGEYPFTKEDAAVFWDKYNELKDEYYPAFYAECLDAAAIVDELIKKSDSKIELEGIRAAIRSSVEEYKLRDPLYKACDDKIATVA